MDSTASRVTITLSPRPDGTTGVRVVEQLSCSTEARAGAGLGTGADVARLQATWASRLVDLELWLLLALERV